MPYKKNYSQMTWSEAFDNHRKYVNQAELEQQVINHLMKTLHLLNYVPMTCLFSIGF